MILVFGGTTEGRRAVGVLEAAGQPYYYSTRGAEQAVELVHGVRLSGAMDAEAALTFCREHDIRLLVDAAHPFAEALHRNVADVAQRAGLPLVRYERIYPPRTPDIHWCRDYEDAMRQMEAAGVTCLLALTGVQTIGRLKPFWQRHATWFRILDRDSSREIAAREGFPEERLVRMTNDALDLGRLTFQELRMTNDALDLGRLTFQELRMTNKSNLSGSSDSNPYSSFDIRHSSFPKNSSFSLPSFDAMLTKESGLSGGFAEKVEAAKAAGQEIFVVERPPLPPFFSASPLLPPSARLKDPSLPALRFRLVDGPHGLRRAVEHLVPGFFPLRSGLTTGTCATAAAVADLLRRQTGETPAEVSVRLPNGETIPVAVGYAEDYAFCIKDSGDDPDVTKGIEVQAHVEPASHFRIIGGEGVGRFTLPGFDYPPGEPAINRGPREMLRDNIDGDYAITIRVKGGRDIARRTFNPRLGIEGGISIIGVSGIIQPYSEDAFLESIRKCLTVAKASGAPRVVIHSGAKSEQYLRERYPELPQQAFVQYGNYVGATLKMAADVGFRHVTLGVMLGKAVKLAAGQMDTHSRRGTFDRSFLQQMLSEAGCDMDISGVTLVRELWDLLPKERIGAFVRVVGEHCRQHCQPLLPEGELTLVIIEG